MENIILLIKKDLKKKEIKKFLKQIRIEDKIKKIILNFKNGDEKFHIIKGEEQIKILNLHYGRIIRIYDLKEATNFYYDFTVLENIKCKKLNTN